MNHDRTSHSRRDYWASLATEPIARDPIYRVIHGVLQAATAERPLTGNGVATVAERATREIRATVPAAIQIPADAPNEPQRVALRKLEQAADVLTASQAAELLGITRARVGVLLRSRSLGCKAGRDWLLSAADLEALRVRKPGRPPEKK